MENLEELTTLAKAVDKIMREELVMAGLETDMAEARIYDVKRVGVQGDARTYGYPAEITLKIKGAYLFPDKEFLDKLSNRITNEVKGIVGVVYTLATRNETS